MKPIKLAIENLSREDATLLSADTILEFKFEKLSLVNSEISKKLMDNFRIRVDEWLNTDVMNLLCCLKNSTITPSRDSITFENESPIVSSEQDNFRWLKAEFTLFKNTGQRTENLQKHYDALLTIKLTSMDVERVFSVCVNFCTKIRSRISDKSLSAIVFLKYYYKK